MMKIWQSLALKDRIKIFIVCIILPLILLGIIIYEAIPEYKKNPDIIAMILNLNESLSRIENEYNRRIENLEQDNMTMKAIFTCNKEKEPEPH